MAESYSVEAVLSARDESFTAGMKAAMDASNSLGNKLKSGLGFGALMAIGSKAVSVVTGSLSGLGKETIETSDSMQKLQQAMRFSGYSEKQVQRIAGATGTLKTYADKTVFSLEDVMSTFGALSANGIKNADKLTESVGNAVAVFGGGAQEYSSVALAFSQAMAAGALHAQDWNQILNASPQLAGGLRKELMKLNPTIAKDFKGAMEKGVITSDLLAKAMNNIGMTKMAKEAAKSVTTFEGAMGNLEATVVSGMMNIYDSFAKSAVIDGINAFNSKLETGFNWLSTNIPKAINAAAPYWNVFKSDVSMVATSFGSAIGAIGKSLSKLNGSFGSVKSVSGFKSVMDGVTGALTKFAGFCEEHSETIAKLGPVLLKLLVAYKGFKIVKSLVPGMGAFSKAITTLAGKGIPAIEGKLFGIGTAEKAVGSASLESGRQIAQSAKAFMMLGVGVMTIAIGFGVLAAAAIALAGAGGPAIGVMVGLGVALAGMMAGMTIILKTLAPMSAQLMPVATAFIALGAAVLLMSVGFGILVAASIKLAEAGTPAIACMAGMVVAVGALMAIAGAVGPAMTAGAIGFIAFGAAIVLVGAGALLAAVSLAIVAGVLPTIVEYGTSGAVAIAALGAGMIVFAAGAALAGAGCIVLGAGFLVVGAGALVAGAGILVLGTALTVTSAGFTSFGNVVKTVVDAISGGFSKVLNGIANVIKSVGESAKNAGQGFKNVAEGIKMISGLSLGSIVKSLGAVAIGIGKISKKGADIQQTASGMRTLSSSAVSVNTSFGSMGAVAAGAFAMIRGSMNGTASAAKPAGQRTGNGFSSAMQSGLKKASSVASSSSKSAANKLRSGYGTARSAGAYISQGFASGMSSCLGQIQSAASQMVSAADAAIRAKAKIHSPSRLTKSHGLNVAIGLALGIRKGIKSVTSASKSLISAASNTLKKATKTRQYEDAAKTAIDKYKTSMDSKTSKTIKSLDKQVDSAVKTLKKKNPKLKKQYDKVGKILKSDISKQIKKQGEKAINAADKALTALGEKYQEKYDKIASDRDNYFSKLSDYGSLYSVDSYGFVALKDFKAQESQVKSLEKNMEKLKGVLPYDLMRDIQDMDTASALQYTNELLKKGDSWLKQYGKDYTNFMNTSKKSSNQYYQSYIDQIDKEYNNAVTDELKKLEKQMKTIGNNAVSGFTKGLTSKSATKALKKAASNLASILTKTVKGKLKIHSPSRVFMSLGEFVGEGFVNGIDSMGRKVSEAMDSITTIPKVSVPVLAGGYDGELPDDYEYYRNTQYTIVVPVEIDGKEYARVTAPYTEAELNKRQARDNRKHGRR